MCHHQATAPISCGQRERDFMLDKLSAVSRGCGQLSSYHTCTTQTPPSHLPSPPDKKLGKLSTSTQDQIYLQLRNVPVSIVLRCGVFADRSVKSTVSCAGDGHGFLVDLAPQLKEDPPSLLQLLVINLLRTSSDRVSGGEVSL